MGRKVIMNKAITFDLIIQNLIFIQQYFILLITKPITLRSNILDIYFVILGIGDWVIVPLLALLWIHAFYQPCLWSYTRLLSWKDSCTIHYQSIVQKNRREVGNNTAIYIAMLQHCSKFLLPPLLQTVLSALL